jgi:predicted enzyme related to lactoylglutathione lyase
MDFYRAVLGVDFDVREIDTGFRMAAFGGSGVGQGGALVWGPEFGYYPSDEGALLYFAAQEPLSIVVGRVDDAGGQVLRDPFGLGGNGFAALLLDCEGNRIALHGWES